MPIVPSRNYGAPGFIADTPAHQVPLAAWGTVRNVRFKGGYVEKLLEAEALDPAFPEPIMWVQQFFDGTVVRMVAASATKLYLLSGDPGTWSDVTNAGGDYSTPADGYWQSFPWGNTVVFNNGVDAPQVWDPATGLFIDIPDWGMVSGADGSVRDTQMRARVIVPYKNFIVSLNLIFLDPDDGATVLEEGNSVLWSDAFTDPHLFQSTGTNPWDYNTTTNLAGKNPVGLEDGPLQWAASLGEGLILYNSSSATQMLAAGGALVMDFRRILPYGCAGLYCAAEFSNRHYVVASDVMYVHDGNTILQVAEDRTRDWFYNNVRNLESSVRLTTDYTQREVLVQFDTTADGSLTSNAEDPHRLALVYNYEDNNYTVFDAAVTEDVTLTPLVCMEYGLDLQQQGNVFGNWDAQPADSTWDDRSEQWNELQGSAGAQAVKVATFWATPTRLYRANVLAIQDPNKSAMIRKTNIDLDEMDPGLTTNFWKHIKRVYPHIIGYGTMRMRFGWSATLMDAPTWQPWIDYVVEDVGQTQYKVDTRTTGRYLAIEYDFSQVFGMRLSGADLDVEPVYGR